jgi:nucleoside-diphosphate-sugar epimerase
MPYGQSKVAAEQYVRTLQDQGAPIATVYPGGIIGPDDPGFSDTFKALHHRINNGFRIFGDGGMQHIDVRDLAEFMVSLLEEGSAGRFLLPGPYCRWTDLADIIERVSGARLERIPASGWKLRLIGRLLDVVRLFKKVDTPISAEMMRYATQWPKIDNTEELARRGMVLRTIEQTFTDSLQWMLSAGYLKPEQVPKLNQ